MKVGIVGCGVVGRATAQAFDEHELAVYDTQVERSTHSLVSATTCDLVFVCLPTPQKVDSLECDTGILDDFFLYAATKARMTNFVLRSTVPVGYTRRIAHDHSLMRLVHSPEFLTERTADEDASNPTRLVIGDPGLSWRSTECVKLLKELYGGAYHGVPFHSDPPLVYTMTSDESEAVKLFQNAFSAVKVACFNEFRRFSDSIGLDWTRVVSALLAGGWINPMHTSVPGPDGERGFGGSCLPKDLANLIACMYIRDMDAVMLEAAKRRNDTIDRRKV